MESLKAYILFPGAAKNPLYSGWLDELPIPFEIVREYDTRWAPDEDAGILITHHHYRWEELSILRRVVSQSQVPVLILVDGVLEYRNSFENPELADGVMFQPLVGHKLACLGASQIRWIESWGNTGKCELVGLPRLDDLIGKPRATLPTTGPFRLLVATARTPWFNETQRESTYRALQALQEQLTRLGGIGDRPLDVVWRMNEELHLNMRAPGFERRRGRLREALQEVHAVITTPSTLQLEAAAMGLPVAVIDFHDCPQMTPMAWQIVHKDQIPGTLRELAHPPAAKLSVQDVLLQDALQLQEPASLRMGQLVSALVEAGRQARQAGRPLDLPDRILDHPSRGFSSPQPSGTRAALFPDHPIFGNQDLEDLRTELAAAIQEMGHYPEKYFQQRSTNQQLRGYINWLRLLIRNRAATIEELTRALQQLRDQSP